MKNKKTALINEDYLGSVHHLWLAEAKVEPKNLFSKILEVRKDAPNLFCLPQEKIENYKKETVYYPIYKYATNTSVYWNTKSTSSSGIYVGNTKVGTTTRTTTTAHERHNVKKLSDVVVKKKNEMLKIENVNTDTLTEIDKTSVNVLAYSPGLVFTKKENHENGIQAGRKGVSKSASTYTTYYVNMILIPISRWTIEYKNKTYYIEVNKHNGEYLSHFPQKPIYAIYKYYTFIVYNLFRLAFIAVPCGLIYTNWSDYGFSSQVGWMGKILYSLLLLVCSILGLIFCIGTKIPLIQFEKYTCSFNPKVTLSKYRLNEIGYLIVIFVVLVGLTIFACGKLFGV